MGGSGGLGEGERSGGGSSSGALFTLPADRAEQSSSEHHGKSPVGALLSAGAAKHHSLCSATITRRRTEGRTGWVYIVTEITGGSDKEEVERGCGYHGNS